jgi:hypothetical protein
MQIGNGRQAADEVVTNDKDGFSLVTELDAHKV